MRLPSLMQIGEEGSAAFLYVYMYLIRCWRRGCASGG